MWLHGEAVAAGMAMAADMSYRLGWIEKDILDRTVRLLERAKLPIAAPAVSPRIARLVSRQVTEVDVSFSSALRQLEDGHSLLRGGTQRLWPHCNSAWRVPAVCSVTALCGCWSAPNLLLHMQCGSQCRTPFQTLRCHGTAG